MDTYLKSICNKYKGHSISLNDLDEDIRQLWKYLRPLMVRSPSDEALECIVMLHYLLRLKLKGESSPLPKYM